MAEEAEKRKEEEAELMKLRKEKAYGDEEEFNKGLEAFKKDFEKGSDLNDELTEHDDLEDGIFSGIDDSAVDDILDKKKKNKKDDK